MRCNQRPIAGQLGDNSFLDHGSKENLSGKRVTVFSPHDPCSRTKTTLQISMNQLWKSDINLLIQTIISAACNGNPRAGGEKMLRYQIRNKTVSHCPNLLPVACSVSILSVALIQSLKKGPKICIGSAAHFEKIEFFMWKAKSRDYSKVSY